MGGFDGGTASGCVGLPTEIVGHPLPLYRHRHGVLSSSSLALLLLARFFSCASPLFLLPSLGTIEWEWMTDYLRWKPYTAACSAAIEAALFLVFLLPYYVVHISVVTWCARIIIQTGSTVCLVSIGRCGTGRSFLQCSSLECNFC